MTRKRDIKKSDFVTVDSSEPTDTFDFVRNGQNLKITQEDLVTSFGGSGPLQTLGDPTAVPVLRVISGISYIRSIIGGAGINVAVDSQDGIQISHNFTIDGAGVPIMINSGADSPTLRSIVAGSGISVTGVAGGIQIASTATPASTKTVNVYTIADFLASGTLVGDSIVLLDDTEYKLQNDVSSAYRYVMGSNTVLSAADGSLIELEYTGSGVMITAVDKNIVIDNIFLSCSTATLFSVSSTTNLHTFRAFHNNFLCNNAGNFNNMGLVYMSDCNFRQIYVQGLTFTNNFGVAIFSTLGATMPSGSGNVFTLGTATFSYFLLEKGIFEVDTTGYIISGLANSGNINAGGLGLLSKSRNFGTGANPCADNITPFDDRWESQHNSALSNSYNVGCASYGGGTITVSGAGVPAKVGATWTPHKEYRFSISSDGIFTYTGNQTEVSITASITAHISTVTDSIGFYIYKNGVQIPQALGRATVTLNDPKNISVVWDEYLENGDYIELYAVNFDTAVSIIIIRANLRIRS